MLVSYTLPCHKRESDLLKVLPSVIAAAEKAPPVEIIVVDYGNPEPLQLPEGVRVVRVERQHFHMAHARNVGIKAATGEIIVAFLADIAVRGDFFSRVREALTYHANMFLKQWEIFAFRREQILEAGGFDERFEFYGPEGKELVERLGRRGHYPVGFHRGLISQIPTPDDMKVQHYRLHMSKHEMHQVGMSIWRANTKEQLMVANEGQLWGVARV